jgi:hypothetical protein
LSVQYEVCNRWNPVGIVLVLARGVRPVILWPLVIGSNLGA